MARIWEPEAKLRIWLEIETYAAEAMAELGVIPKDAAEAVKARGAFDIARIDQIEREVKHDVIAFLTSVAEHVGPEARVLHQGLTSSDVLDTCLNVQLARAADLLIADVDALLEALKARAFEHKNTPTIGRSHGVHAEPTTFGLKLASAYAEFARARARLEAARAEVSTRGLRRQETRPDARADLDASHPARSPRHVFCCPWRGGELGGAPCHGNSAFAAHRGARGGGIFQSRAKGLLGHAA
jgi:adenylosuccinate lyase